MVDQTMLRMLCAEERVEELLELLDAHPAVPGFKCQWTRALTILADV